MLLIPFTFENDARLILSDGHGVYIPQLFCADIDVADAARIGVDFTDAQCCQAGPTPSNEWYWEAWQAILDSAVMTDGNAAKLKDELDKLGLLDVKKA